MLYHIEVLNSYVSRHLPFKYIQMVDDSLLVFHDESVKFAWSRTYNFYLKYVFYNTAFLLTILCHLKF